MLTLFTMKSGKNHPFTKEFNFMIFVGSFQLRLLCDFVIIQHIILQDCKTHDKLFQHSFDSITCDGEVCGSVP